jgi:hypothetical protein
LVKSQMQFIKLILVVIIVYAPLHQINKNYYHEHLQIIIVDYSFLIRFDFY